MCSSSSDSTLSPSSTASSASDSEEASTTTPSSMSLPSPPSSFSSSTSLVSSTSPSISLSSSSTPTSLVSSSSSGKRDLGGYLPWVDQEFDILMIQTSGARSVVSSRKDSKNRSCAAMPVAHLLWCVTYLPKNLKSGPRPVSSRRRSCLSTFRICEGHHFFRVSLARGQFVSPVKDSFTPNRDTKNVRKNRAIAIMPLPPQTAAAVVVCLLSGKPSDMSRYE